MYKDITTSNGTIQNKIYTIRNLQVMLDRDLAELYGVETKRINEAVKNNPEKFPNDFMFALTQEEFNDLQSKFSTTSFSKVRVFPKVFTEQGVYMLATIIKSKIATQTTLSIMRTFTNLKHFISSNSFLFDRFERIEQRLNLQDKNFNKIFETIENQDFKLTQGIFHNGQIYDAYSFVNDLLRSAEKEIILIDNFIDDTTLTLLSKYSNIQFTIITKSISKQLKLDIDKYNKQYDNLEIKISNKYHDRFLIIDKNKAYHIGASLKDLGKKVFGFSKINVKLVMDNKDGK